MKKKILQFIPFVFFLFILTYIAQNNSFFWDTILNASKQAHWYYENKFAYFLLPNEFDVHPPLFGMYLATTWFIFGKTLIVSHWAMLPFLIALVWQLMRLVRNFFQPRFVFIVTLLLFADATLLAQASIVSPDIVLVLLFFWSLNSILYRRRTELLIALIFICLINMRGIFALISLALFDVIYDAEKKQIAFDFLRNSFSVVIKKSLWYLPAIAILFSYLAYRYHVKGWITLPEKNDWQESFAAVGLFGFLRNIVILVWRLVDFGRIIWWLIAFYFFVRWLKKKIVFDETVKIIFAIFILNLFVGCTYFLTHKNVTIHRYLIPSYLLFGMIILYLICQNIHRSFVRNLFFAGIFIFLVSGNFWVYPDGIAKGWDATLAHLPYYGLRQQMLEYMQQQNIPVNETGSSFPNVAKIKYIDLNNDTRNFDEKDFAKHKYIFQSNIYNGFPKKDFTELQLKWKVRKEFRKGFVYVKLWEKK